MLIAKRGAEDRWKTNARHPGAVHITMDKAGAPSRWNTLIALRALQYFGLLEPLQ
ncbi:MAG: hypothetical protein MO846_02060 [Candidatus Devosia symbiotica]|nr:hypothetical protein [Candidatus Devosia symbiotica]